LTSVVDSAPYWSSSGTMALRISASVCMVGLLSIIHDHQMLSFFGVSILKADKIPFFKIDHAELAVQLINEVRVLDDQHELCRRGSTEGRQPLMIVAGKAVLCIGGKSRVIGRIQK